jgi:hypothetical protein
MRQFPLALSSRSFWQPPQAPAERHAEASLDYKTARALVDAGYMSLRAYIEHFGFDPPGEGEVVKVGDHCARCFH